MKILIIILIIAAFLQTTILPIDLVLLILLCRAYIKSDKANLYLSFAFGFLISHLNLTALGFQSLVYLVIISATHALSKLRLAGNPLLIVPVSMAFLFFSQSADLLTGYQALDFPKIIFTAILSLPTLYLVRMWEERFIVHKEIKLRV